MFAYTSHAMNLATFLERHRVKKGAKGAASSTHGRGKITHTSMGDMLGSFSIPDEEMEQFLQLYFVALEEGDHLSLIERPLPPYGLIVVDIDINFTAPAAIVNPRGYSDQLLERTVAHLVSTLEEYLVLETSKMRDVYVTTKRQATLKGDDADGRRKYKDGFHLFCPNIVATVATRDQIRCEFVERMVEVFDAHEDLLASQNINMHNDADEIIDKSIIKSNGMMMYASRKPGGQPYSLSSIWQHIGGKMVAFRREEKSELTPIFHDRLRLVKLLSLRRPVGCSDVAVLTDYGTRQVEAHRAKEKTQYEQQHRGARKGTSKMHFNEDFEFVQGLVEMLSSERAKQRTTWMEVGWCLHNIDHRLLTDWIAFSQLAVEYEDTAKDDCEREWDAMEDRGLGMGTLHFWANKDSPDRYRQFVQQSLEFEVRRCAEKLEPAPPPVSALGGASSAGGGGAAMAKDKKGEMGAAKPSKRRSIYDILHWLGRVIHRARHHSYVCAAFQAKSWFKFNGNRWVPDDGGVTLRTDISTDLMDIFTKSAEKYRAKIRSLDANDQESHARYERIARSCDFIAEKMVVTDVKSKLMNEIAEIFYWQNLKYNTDSRELREKQFEEILDNNHMLVGMKNGVYDLQTHSMRPGRCEDYLTMTTGVEYDMEGDYTWVHPLVWEILTFFSQVLPKVEVRNFVLTLLSSFMDGNTGREKFHIWVGQGGNGKSKIIELFQRTMGEYCGTANITLLTGKRADSSAPTPDVLATKGKRLVVLQEPNENEKIQVGKMKELTGGDVITARGLHKEPIEFKPQFTMVLTCNHLPSVPADDGGTRRRMCVTRFGSKFVDHPDPADPDEFPIDINLSKKFETWTSPFFWMLAQFYRVYREGGEIPGLIEGAPADDLTAVPMCAVAPGIQEPADVQLATKMYLKRNDHLQEFIEECTCEQKGRVVDMKRIWSRYDRWCKETSIQAMTRANFQDAVSKRWGDIDPKLKGWKNHDLRAAPDSVMGMVGGAAALFTGGSGAGAS